MNDNTRAALIALAEALATDKAGAAELNFYGGICEHIADAVSELEDDDDDA
jgi:hypothetical protein